MQKDFDVRKVKKDLDVKAQIDAMTFHSGAKMRNITCVMQELGYLDEHLEPNYEKMMERINKLQVPEELKRDMVDGVKFCRQFSVSSTRKYLNYVGFPEQVEKKTPMTKILVRSTTLINLIIRDRLNYLVK